jgi:hypothetical protein
MYTGMNFAHKMKPVRIIQINERQAEAKIRLSLVLNTNTCSQETLLFADHDENFRWIEAVLATWFIRPDLRGKRGLSWYFTLTS